MRERILEIVNSCVRPTRKFKDLEKLTGVKARSWQNLCIGRQRANEEHIEAIGRVWPQYAFWLVTGKTDESNGHTSPILERIQRDLQKVGKNEA